MNLSLNLNTIWPNSSCMLAMIAITGHHSQHNPNITKLFLNWIKHVYWDHETHGYHILDDKITSQGGWMNNNLKQFRQKRQHNGTNIALGGFCCCCCGLSLWSTLTPQRFSSTMLSFTIPSSLAQLNAVQH